MSHKIVIRQGQLSTLYTDKLPLHQLGRLEVTRASNVEYDNVRGGWTVELADGTMLDGCWARREDALAAEVEVVNSRL